MIIFSVVNYSSILILPFLISRVRLNFHDCKKARIEKFTINPFTPAGYSINKIQLYKLDVFVFTTKCLRKYLCTAFIKLIDTNVPVDITKTFNTWPATVTDYSIILLTNPNPTWYLSPLLSAKIDFLKLPKRCKPISIPKCLIPTAMKR